MFQRRWYTEKTDSKRIYQRICGSMKLYNIDRLKDKYILYFESEDTTYHIIKYIDEDGNTIEKSVNKDFQIIVCRHKTTFKYSLDVFSDNELVYKLKMKIPAAVSIQSQYEMGESESILYRIIHNDIYVDNKKIIEKINEYRGRK